MFEVSKIKAIFNNHHSVIFGFILLSFCFDFINKIDVYYDLDLIKLNRILKAIFFLYSLKFIVTHFKYVIINLKFLAVIVAALTAAFLLKNNFEALYFNEFIRYIFILLTFPLIFYTYLNKNENLRVQLYVFFKWFIIINTIAVLIGIFFEVKIFQTYQFPGRYAYNGFILSQGSTPFIYLCATIIFWVCKDIKMLFLTILLSTVSGLKGVYFGEFLLLTALVLINQEFTRIFKIKILIFLTVLFFGLLTVLLLTPTFVAIFEQGGLLSAIFSYRTDNLIQVFKQITSENYNIFIGALHLKVIRVEMQIFDIILFFGVLGFIVYTAFLFFLNKNLVTNNTSKVFFITTLILSVLSGNLFYIPISSILMFLILIALYNYKSIK